MLPSLYYLLLSDSVIATFKTAALYLPLDWTGLNWTLTSEEVLTDCSHCHPLFATYNPELLRPLIGVHYLQPPYNNNSGAPCPQSCCLWPVQVCSTYHECCSVLFLSWSVGRVSAIKEWTFECFQTFANSLTHTASKAFSKRSNPLFWFISFIYLFIFLWFLYEAVTNRIIYSHMCPLHCMSFGAVPANTMCLQSRVSCQRLC